MKAAAEEQGITQQEAEQQFIKTMRPTSLLNRFATTEEVANLVIYVCSGAGVREQLAPLCVSMVVSFGQ